MALQISSLLTQAFVLHLRLGSKQQLSYVSGVQPAECVVKAH